MTPLHVFLDQNHWIYLAQAYWGKARKSTHKLIPAEILHQVDNGHIRLPLSVLHLIELLRHERPDGRQRLAMVFERFSRGWFIDSWTDVLSAEIYRAVVQAFDPQHASPLPEVFGRGFLFGISAEDRAKLLLNWTVEDTEKLNWLTAQTGALFDLLTFPNELNRKRQKEHISELNLQDASAAEDLRAARKPYSKDMHRQAQYASYTYQFQDQIRVALSSAGRTFDDFLALGLGGLSQFWSRVPSLDVDCELTLYRDRQWSRKIEANDFNDIGYLALAIPYCDVVVVERFWARALQETGLADKYQVFVCSDLEELSELPLG